MRSLERLCDGLEDAEFSIPGQIVADIAVVGRAAREARRRRSASTIEALTIAE